MPHSTGRHPRRNLPDHVGHHGTGGLPHNHTYRTRKYRPDIAAKHDRSHNKANGHRRQRGRRRTNGRHRRSVYHNMLVRTIKVNSALLPSFHYSKFTDIRVSYTSGNIINKNTPRRPVRTTRGNRGSDNNYNGDGSNRRQDVAHATAQTKTVRRSPRDRDTRHAPPD